MAKGLKSIVAAVSVGALLAGSAWAGDVVVHLKGGKAEGTLYVVLYDEATYNTDDNVDSQITENFEGGDVTVTFKDVEPGTYAFTAWHDLDADGDFDMNQYGMPIDGFAARAGTSLMGPPTWTNQKFEVSEDTVEMTEPLIYMAQ
ncbi:DUF2141 domain-containing protein [Parvularcula sp. LCG005]|uniref:DUF2141 domain-containing protein n=1 Tax=Parvularcula sp. LCG005 TaxID=3078805 RepID=UPI002942B852|nr:DUF2141 domain-containing protein [Parvularcula sp. LCG005]WOI53784.1 DUF2141 domain-containing protein [Parvularcula sp. LCG005]